MSGISEDLFAMKLYEMEQQYGKLQGRLRVCCRERREELQEELKKATDKLADWATHQMVNGSGENHHWSTSDIEKSFARMGLQKPESMTWGDAMYSSNMHYADYYGKSLPTEKDCLIQAHADLTDIDGYPGKIFNRWYSDMLGKHVDVPWSDFI